MVVFCSIWSMGGFQLKNSLKKTPRKFASDLRVMQLFLNESVSEFGGSSLLCLAFEKLYKRFFCIGS